MRYIRATVFDYKSKEGRTKKFMRSDDRRCSYTRTYDVIKSRHKKETCNILNKMSICWNKEEIFSSR